MADIAQIGFSADTGDLKEAKASLDALVPSAENVDRANEQVAGSFNRVGQAAGVASNGLRTEKTALDQAASGAMNHTKAVEKLIAANTSAAASLAAAGRDARQFDSHIVAYRQSLLGAGNAIKFTAAEGLNFTRQMSDIGVTLAMGMNPLMVALQQGPQLFDIMQTAGMRAGVGIGAVFRAAGAVIWTALAPILPIVLAIAAAVAVVAAGFGLAARAINQGAGDMTAGLGLTEKQLEKVKKSGVDTAVTISDVFFGFFDVVGERLTKAFDGPLKWLADAWNSTMDFITKYGLLTVKAVIGFFVGAVYAIRDGWSLLPGALGDIAIQAANGVIAAVEWMINKSISGINVLITMANAAAAQVGLSGFDKLSDVSINPIANQFDGMGSKLRKAVGNGFRDGLHDASQSVDSFLGDVGNAARRRARNRILAAAGEAAPGSDGADKADKPKHGEKTNAEKFDEMIAGADRQLAQLKRAGAEIGLYGEALSRARYEHQLLNEAAEKGIKLGPAEIATIKTKASELAKQAEANRTGSWWQGQIEKAELENAMFARQRGELNLTGEALIAYRYETELLLDAKRQHIELSAQEISAIHQSSVAYAANAEEIRKQKEALDGAKDVARGFFQDLYQNARHGQSVWSAFANAFVSAIDKMIDKLVNSQIDKMINSMFDQSGSGGGGGGWFEKAMMTIFAPNAKGNGFDSGGVVPFAAGGVFTNSIVDSPTLFKFAAGGKFGVMGEAGPEAILPLKRGTDGNLGVRMNGGGSRGAPNINVTLETNHYLTGALSTDDIVRVYKESAKATEAQLRQKIPQIIEQYNRDGVLV